MTLTVQRPQDDYIDLPRQVVVNGEEVDSTTFHRLFGFVPREGQTVRLKVTATPHPDDLGKVDSTADTAARLEKRRGA